jgi:hypothetical protein
MVRSQFNERCALVLAPAPESQLTHAHTLALAHTHFCGRSGKWCPFPRLRASTLPSRLSHASLHNRYMRAYELAAGVSRTGIVCRSLLRLATFPYKAETRAQVAWS